MDNEIDKTDNFKDLKCCIEKGLENGYRVFNVEKLCQLIDEAKITLPVYQRNLKWDLKKSVALLNYQLTESSPISSLAFNVPGQNYVPQVAFITRKDIDRKTIENNIKTSQQVFSVVDGQQRLSTYYQAFIDHEDFKSIVLDMNDSQFKCIEDLNKISLYQIPVGKLLNKRSFELSRYMRNKLKEFKVDNDKIDEVIDILIQCRNKILKYTYTINTAENLDVQQQITWFKVLNQAGSRATDIEVNLALYKGPEGEDIYSSYINPFIKTMTENTKITANRTRAYLKTKICTKSPCKV